VKKNPEEKIDVPSITLKDILSALDRKDYDWWDNLLPEQQKQVSMYMALQWSASVVQQRSDSDLSKYLILMTEYWGNVNFFSEKVSSHPGLQWRALCGISPGDVRIERKWISKLNPDFSNYTKPINKKEASEYFKKMYPNAATSDLNQISVEYAKIQNSRHELLTLFPNLKKQDIEILSELISDEEVKEYKRSLGE
jgi:hypothetical protein